MSDIIDTKAALALMPAITKTAFAQLLTEGKGPKHARIGNAIKFRKSDIEGWYAKFQENLFKETKLIRRKVTSAHVSKATKVVKNGKAKAEEKALLG